MIRIPIVIIYCFILFASLQLKAQNKEAESGIHVTDFKNPPAVNHMHTWWHFIDNYITKEGITKDLEAMHQQGIQGATILNINRFDGKLAPATAPFNSPAWFDMFKHALKEASRLNMEIGVHNCDGWSTSGGPWITPETSMKLYVWRKNFIQGGRKVAVKLDQPAGNSNFYKDAYVVAYKSPKPNSFSLAAPSIKLIDKNNGPSLADGNPGSSAPFKIGEPILINFKTDFTAEVLLVHTQRSHSRNGTRQTTTIEIEASQDGNNFTKIAEVLDTMVNETFLLPFPTTTAKSFRITIKDITGSAEKEMRIAELALLKNGEKGLYQPSIYAHQAKTVAVSPNDMADFYTTTPTGNINDIVQNASDVTDLTGNMQADGTLNWNAPAGDWTIIRFGYTTTGKKVHPATKEGDGLECDKMDTTVLNLHFQAFPQKLIEAAGALKGKTFTYLLVDSWEAYFQNWTANFGNEFKKRRGYSLIPYIPVLCGEMVESNLRTEAFLHDFRKTIADLIEENYFKHMADLCHRQGLKLHSESMYGGVVFPPLDILKSYSYFDVPMTEFWAPVNAADTPFRYSPKNKMTATIPTHAALLYNKPVIASESYTGFSLYSTSPWDLKLYGDKAITEGVNRFVLHSYVHQPTEKKPGITLGMYGLEFNRHNTWWPFASSYFDEQARVQYMMQKARTVCDALVYAGDKLPYKEWDERTANLLPGVRFNYVNADVLYSRITVADGKLMLDNKIPFFFLVVNDPLLDLATVQKLESLVKQGATIIAPKPLQTLSLHQFEKNNAGLQKIVASMWGDADGKLVTEHVYGKGKIIWGKPLAQIVNDGNYIRDFEVNGADMQELMYIHKSAGDWETYYIVNKSNDKQLQMEARFRVTGKAPEIWDPVDGKTYPQVLYLDSAGTTLIPLALRPRQSLLVVFKKASGAAHFVQLNDNNGKQLFPSHTDVAGTVPAVYFDKDGKIKITGEKGGSFSLVSNQKETTKMILPDVKMLTMNEAKGLITLEDEPDVVPFNIDKFASLTSSDNPLVKYYSGIAAYRMELNIPSGFVQKDQSIFLQLNEFGAAATIELNGKMVAGIWEPGYKLDITDFVKAGINKAVIKVVNPWRNRLIGDMVSSRGEDNAWTTSTFKENAKENVINKNAPLLYSGISKPIKIYCVSATMVQLNNPGTAYHQHQ